MLTKVLIFSSFIFNHAIASETYINFEDTSVKAELVRPGLQMIHERASNTNFEPYTFHEICTESADVIKHKKDISLRLVEGSGILHEDPSLIPGNYRVCILNSIKSHEPAWQQWEMIQKKGKIYAFDTPKRASYALAECEKEITYSAYGTSAIMRKHCEDAEFEYTRKKYSSMIFESLRSYNIYLLFPDLHKMDNLTNSTPYKDQFYGTNSEEGVYKLPKLAIARLKRIKDDKIVYIAFDEQSVQINRTSISFNMNEQSWLLYLEKVD